MLTTNPTDTSTKSSSRRPSLAPSSSTTQTATQETTAPTSEHSSLTSVSQYVRLPLSKSSYFCQIHTPRYLLYLPTYRVTRTKITPTNSLPPTRHGSSIHRHRNLLPPEDPTHAPRTPHVPTARDRLLAPLSRLSRAGIWELHQDGEQVQSTGRDCADGVEDADGEFTYLCFLLILWLQVWGDGKGERREKRREGKGREGKGREGKGREGKGQDGWQVEGKRKWKSRRRNTICKCRYCTKNGHRRRALSIPLYPHAQSQISIPALSDSN